MLFFLPTSRLRSLSLYDQHRPYPLERKENARTTYTFKATLASLPSWILSTQPCNHSLHSVTPLSLHQPSHGAMPSQHILEQPEILSQVAVYVPEDRLLACALISCGQLLKIMESMKRITAPRYPHHRDPQSEYRWTTTRLRLWEATETTLCQPKGPSPGYGWGLQARWPRKYCLPVLYS